MIDSKTTQVYFNYIASSWVNSEADKLDRLRAILSRLDLGSAQTILDLGCGTGILFPLLSQLTNNHAHLFAVDFSPCMTRLAAEANSHAVHIICGDAQYLPFAEHTFDRIVAFQVFPHIHQKRLALQECWRILKFDGEFAIIHLHSSAELNEVHAEVGGAIKKHTLPPSHQMIFLLEELHYDVIHAIDNTGQYFLHARKKKK